MSRLPLGLLPDNATVGGSGALGIAGCDAVSLAERFGTPLFVYDEAHLRARCKEAVDAFGDGVAYATKAFLCKAMASLAHEEGMCLDVATGGELHVALKAGVPAERLVMHGNNKSPTEIRMALRSGVGRIVVDSFDELDRLDELVAEEGSIPPRVLVRVTPGVEAHTHEYLQTGVADSKFGFDVAGGTAEAAIQRVRSSRTMQLAGIHAHIGSQIFVTESFAKAIEVLAPLSAMAGGELSIGGGLGVAYVIGESAPSISDWAEAVSAACATAGIEARVVAEPGRSIVARAAVTLYRVGTIKRIEGVRTYVAVDGGMSDNPRPVLYGSGYEAFLPRSTSADRDAAVRIVGKHCESGDVIVSEASVPSDIEVGDVLATPVTGAYGHSMGSNYNMVLRPAVVFVANGEARLVVRRETYEDLTLRDV